MTPSLEDDDLPRPRTARPLGAIDARGSSQAYIEMLSILYYAEKAALDAFERLSDPTIVENCEIFLQAQPMLLADESSHLKDVQEIISLLGGSGIQPRAPGFSELWDLTLLRRKILFPLQARVAALFTLVTESLGYAYLYPLTDATSQLDQKISSLLRANVRDEGRHIRVSMDVLRATLKHSRIVAVWELTFHFWVFLLLSRRAARTMFSTLARVGFDPYVVAGSSLDFTCCLLRKVAEEKLGRSVSLRLLTAMSPYFFSPRMMRLFEGLCLIPEPPFIWPTLRGFAGMMRRIPSTSLETTR